MNYTIFSIIFIFLLYDIWKVLKEQNTQLEKLLNETKVQNVVLVFSEWKKDLRELLLDVYHHERGGIYLSDLIKFVTEKGGSLDKISINSLHMRAQRIWKEIGGKGSVCISNETLVVGC